MIETMQWKVDIHLSEDERETQAQAYLIAPRAHDVPRRLEGTGRARRNPTDVNVPEIGEELATARALSDLAHKLLHVAAEDIEAITHQPAHLRE